MARKYATADTVAADDLHDFIRGRHHMVLTTFRADGSLQTSPVTGGLDEQGRIVVASYPKRAKAANIRRDPRASVLVLSDDFNGPYVQVDGPAEVISLPEAVRPGRLLPCGGRRTSELGRVPAGDGRSGKCLIRVTPQRWGPVATGGFPPP